MATAPKITATVLVAIGMSANVVESERDDYTDVIAASPSPRYAKRDKAMGDSEWADYCATVRAEADASQSDAIKAARKACKANPKGVTVLARANAFGTMGSDGRYSQYPTVSDPEGWREVGLLARALGCTVTIL